MYIKVHKNVSNITSFQENKNQNYNTRATIKKITSPGDKIKESVYIVLGGTDTGIMENNIRDASKN